MAVDIPMNERAREWKVFRAVVRGRLPADPETRKAWKAEAEDYEANGLPWLVDGFDEVEPDAVLGSLREIGVELDRATFLAAAEELPGPYEMAESWVEAAGLEEIHDVDRAWMAARRLWAAWLPEELSIETAADAIEEVVIICEKAPEDEREESLFSALTLFVASSEGDRLVADALVDELPVHFWSWMMRKFDALQGVADVESWLELAEKIAFLFPSAEIFRLAIARFRHRHGQHEKALEDVAGALAEQPPFSFLLYQGAETYQALGISDRALSLATRGLACAGDERDEQEGGELITKILSAAGRGEEAPSYIAQAQAERRRGELEKRKERRRKEKKGKRRR